MYPIEIKKEKYEANDAICLMAFSEGTEDMFGVITTNVPDDRLHHLPHTFPF